MLLWVGTWQIVIIIIGDLDLPGKPAGTIQDFAIFCAPICI